MFEFLISVVVLVLAVRFSNRLSRLTDRLAELENKLAGRPMREEFPTGVHDLPVPPRVPSVLEQVPPRPPPPIPTEDLTLTQEMARPKLPPEPAPYVPTEWDRKIEVWKKQFAENWTGILGAVILVAGVAFFGVLASLWMEADARFCMILVGAGAFYGLSWWLRRKLDWEAFAGWMQGISGAIALFACVGAGGFPGLKFIDNPAIALAVLIAGILLNLFFAYRASQQALASFHAILTLTALMIAPATVPILVTGASVTAAVLLLSYRARWDVHLLLSLLAFTLFHALWLSAQHGALDPIRPLGVVCVLLVGIAAALVHYRKDYASLKLEPLPFAVHIVNWTALGISLVRYAHGSKTTPVLLLVGAVGAWALARVAKKRGIRWLHVTDTIVGQTLALVGIALMGRWGLGGGDLALLAFTESVLFAGVAAREGDEAVLRVAYPMLWVALMTLIGMQMNRALEGQPGMHYEIGLRFGLAGLIAFAFSWAGARWSFVTDDPRFVIDRQSIPRETAASPFLFAVPLLFFLGYVVSAEMSGASAVFAAVLMALAEDRRRHETAAGSVSLLGVWGLFHFIIGAKMFSGQTKDLWPSVQEAAPLMVLDVLLLATKQCFSKRMGRLIAWPVAYGLAILVAVATYRWAGPFSDFAPGVVYLILSLVLLEFSLAIGGRAMTAGTTSELADRSLHCGYFFLMLFIGRHWVVHLQSELSVGPVSLRLLLSLIGTATLIYWASYSPRSAPWGRLSRGLTPFLVEWLLVFSVVTIAVEAPTAWHPVAWSLIALGLLLLTTQRGWPNRLLHYSWLFNLASIINLAATSSQWRSPGGSWTSNTAILGLAAIALQFAYVALAFQGKYLRREVLFPRGLGIFQKMHEGLLGKHLNAAVLYPLVFGVALFLYWRFDRAILTLLWVIEIFAVFSLGTFLREKHFIHVAFCALALCVGRLIFYDLEQTEVAVRALVFVAVGGLMLLMNALFRKYRSRFLP